MQRWDSTTNTQVEDLKVDAFIQDILHVCSQHRMCISHEDGHGSFVIVKDVLDDQFYFNWLKNANIGKD